MHLRRLWLKDFRSHAEVDLELSAGLCAVVGENGVGKSNLVEAIGYLALLESFRGAPNDAMIRAGCDTAVVRGEVSEQERVQLIEAELRRVGPNRVQLNRQRLSRSSDLLGALRVVVFAPDDLALVKAGPAGRRTYLDQLLVALDARNDAVRVAYDKAVRQRNALLKQTRGRLDDAAQITLEVWDAKVVESGEALAELRDDLVSQLGPFVSVAYADVAGDAAEVVLRYDAPWREVGLAESLVRVRDDELRRAVTLVGPHRDDLVIELNGLPARTHASQGEQRSLALALRLAAHRCISRSTGADALLLLDDVFSELDQRRSAALIECLPAAQTLLTSAAGLPAGIRPDQIVEVLPGSVLADDVGATAGTDLDDH